MDAWSAPINLVKGWNLVGNSSSTAIDAPATLGDATTIATVWKWNKTLSKWAFYTPKMDSFALEAYAQAKGYEVLTSIASKEGFWVNADAAVTVNISSVNPAMLTEADLPIGWGLLSSANNQHPSQLSSDLGVSLNAAGKNITTIWAWDAAASKWMFYSPALEAQIGSALGNYIATKGYLPFTGALSAIQGYWVNVGSVVPDANSYPLQSEEFAAFKLFNRNRTTCGFGALARNASLDAAALNHVKWLTMNNFSDGPYEQANFTSGIKAGEPTIGFTGTDVAARVRTAGYGQPNVFFELAEEYGSKNSANKIGTSAQTVKEIFGNVYSMRDALGPFRDIGIAVKSGGAPGLGLDIEGEAGFGSRVFFWSTLGYLSNAQLESSADVLTYPCEGTVSTSVSSSSNMPTPIAGRNISANPLGQPIYVRVRRGNALMISNASLTQVNNGAVVAIISILTSATDPNGRMGSNEAFLLPDTPLLPNTQYEVKIDGRNDGILFGKSFKFTTADNATVITYAAPSGNKTLRLPYPTLIDNLLDTVASDLTDDPSLSFWPMVASVAARSSLTEASYKPLTVDSFPKDIWPVTFKYWQKSTSIPGNIIRGPVDSENGCSLNLVGNTLIATLGSQTFSVMIDGFPSATFFPSGDYKSGDVLAVTASARTIGTLSTTRHLSLSAQDYVASEPYLFSGQYYTANLAPVFNLNIGYDPGAFSYQNKSSAQLLINVERWGTVAEVGNTGRPVTDQYWCQSYDGFIR